MLERIAISVKSRSKQGYNVPPVAPNNILCSEADFRLRAKDTFLKLTFVLLFL